MKTLRYFYHPDYLGSSSVSTPLNNHWITDGSGNAIQHLHYLPFGEDWVDQRNGSWNAPYTFSGKEKDVETGYSYFGARYYDSGLSIWLSVDPMSDKYPNLTPYAYCANNPVILVDPDGRKVVYADDVDDEFKAAFAASIQHLNNHKAAGFIATLEESNITYYVTKSKDGNSTFDSSSRTISWNPDAGLLTNEGHILSPTTVLAHEFGHALIYDQSMKADKMKEYWAEKVEGSDPIYGTKNEMYVITGIEQRIAKALGEIKEGEVTRTDHYGQLIPTVSPTSNVYKTLNPVEVTADAEQ